MFNSVYLSELILYFAIYSFLGWFLEVLYVSYKSKKIVNRGFLFGPFCPIYGFGVLSLIILLSPISYSPFLFFIGAVIVTSSLEYFTGFILESIFKTTWWSYSDEKYNFDGKICLKFSLYWGFLSLFLFYFIHPTINLFTSKLIHLTSFYLSLAIFLYFLADFIFTIISLYGFKNILEKFNQLKNQKIDQLELDHLKKEINEKQNEIFKHFTQKYKRLIRAFPNLKSSKYYILDDIKTKIEEIKTKNQFH